MVAVSSRFAVLAALCAVASVTYTPLIASAAAVEARHSDKKVVEKLSPEGGSRLAKQPVIPLPHKLNKSGLKGTGKTDIVEHGRTHKTKKKEHFPVEQTVRLAQFPVRFGGLYQRHYDDDDCPDKVIVNGDKDHVHLSCRHHDHHDDHHDHDHHDEVVVNGDRDHVRVSRENVQLRSPRHARPSIQRRNDTTDAGSASKGVVGTIEVQGFDPSNGQPRSYGEFLVENRESQYEIRVSKTNHTTFKMTDLSSGLQSNDSRSTPVYLEAILPGDPDRRCCAYDANPSSSAPMRLLPCQTDGSGDGHSTQTFGYDSATGHISLLWAGSSNQTSTQTSNSTAARRDDAQNSGNSVSMTWRPVSQNTTARVEGATQTVTVTVTAGPESSSIGATSAAREMSTTMADSMAPSHPMSSVSSTIDAPASTQAARTDVISSAPTTPSPTSVTEGSASPSSPTELKIEVAPGDPSSSSSSMSSVTPSSSASAGANPSPSGSLVATSPGAFWGVPVRDGEVTDTVLEPRYVKSGLNRL